MTYEIKKQQRPAKQPKPINCQTCRYKCHNKFSDEERKVLCQSYWKLTDFRRQKDFLLNHITTKTPERRRYRNNNRPPRKYSKQYYFEKNKDKLRVCQAFFLKTLNISNDVVLNAFSHKGPAGTYIGEDKRGKSKPGNKTPDDVVADIKSHIESFPTNESHHARKSTRKKYLDSTLSISKMYSLYKEKCEQGKKQAASFITYKRIFGKDYNLSFFKPKKDLCQICEKNKNKPVTADYQQENDESYLSHLRRKEDCYAEKKKDKERAIREETFCSVTFDLQSVLQIPCSDVSPMYYSRKICVYNLTIYESAPPNNAFCFCWTELNGKRGSSEIGSCLFEYLNNLPLTVKEVSLWSDTCGGQNRNQHVAALLYYLVNVSHIEVIEHKFLESGHSYMEADSMHSAIEHAKKYIPVYTIQDWLNIFRIARSKRNRNRQSEPYHVRELKFNEFYDLKALSELLIKNRSKDIEGNTVNWLLIKSLRYSKKHADIIEYKYEHSSEYKVIKIWGRGRPPAPPKQLKKLYGNLLPISTKKKEDLVKLCKSGAIPPEFHGWYQSLSSAKNVQEGSVGISDQESDCDSDNEPLAHYLIQKSKRANQEKSTNSSKI